MMNNKELVFIENNRVVTDSLTVAEVFDKRHDSVIRDIENQIEKIKSSWREGVFTPQLCGVNLY